jgi:hypothetical protein
LQQRQQRLVLRKQLGRFFLRQQQLAACRGYDERSGYTGTRPKDCCAFCVQSFRTVHKHQSRSDELGANRTATKTIMAPQKKKE